MLAFTLLLCLAFSFSVVRAGPLVLRDVFNPTILSPNASTVWPIGTTQPVIWKTDNIPPDSKLTNPTGMVVLGHLGPTGGLNLNLTNPLAQNFSIRQGSVQITVPDVPPRKDYIIVLFGDSGNSSPAFAITQITGGGGSSSSGSLSATSSTSSSSSSSSSSGDAPTTTTSSTTDVVETTVIPVPSSLAALLSSISSATYTAAPSPTSISSTSSAPSPLKQNSASPRHYSGWMRTSFSVCIASLVIALVL